ncbi:MAG: glycosyltransferase [Streptosporangiales bacterium]|nr:glycosyltransferase [Streptosporangiales bacterium]
MHLVRAGVFTAALGFKHLRTEPARAPLLALRALPAGVRGPVRRAMIACGGLPRAYAWWHLGRREDTLAWVKRAAEGAPQARLARLAAFTVAVEQAEPAAELIGTLPSGPRRDRLAARLERKTGGRHPMAGTPLPGTARPGQRPLKAVPGRVLHLVTNALPHTNAGYSQRTQRIAAAQRAEGLDPHVVTRAGHPLTSGSLDARRLAVVDGVPYHRVLPWLPPRDAAASVAATAEGAAALVRRLRPEILHAASDHHNAEVALALRARYGIPVVYEVRGFLEESWLSRDPRRTVEAPYYRHARERETACMTAADLVVTLGEAMREEIVARGVPADRVLVVPNAVDDGFLEPLPDPGNLRESLGIPAETVVVGATTSCFGYEGLDTLLDAVAELRGRGARVHALIVGDGPELPALRRRAARLGLTEPGAVAAHFPGRVNSRDVRRYHAVLDVFTVPRKNDRVCQLVTPLKPVEAMAGGLPVVASQVAAMREIVEPEVTGELIPPDDPVALADRLELLVYSPKRRAELGRAAKARIGTDRTWRTAARRYREAYGRLSGLE